MPKTILCLGDSITFGYGLPRRYCWTRLVSDRTGLRMRNRGVCGDTTAGMLSRLYTELEAKPDMAIILGGTNDILASSDTDRARENIESMVQKCLKAEVRPILCSPPPMDYAHLTPQWAAMVHTKNTPLALDEYVFWLRSFARSQNIIFVDINEVLLLNEKFSDLFVDGIHMSKLGNECISAAICNVLSQTRQFS